MKTKNIYKIKDAISIRQRLTESFSYDPSLDVNLQEKADLMFSFEGSTFLSLVMGDVAAMLKMCFFNPGSENARIQGFRFSLDDDLEIPWISDMVFPMDINWESGVQTVTCSLLRPPGKVNTYAGKAKLISDTKTNPESLNFEIILRDSKSLSERLVIFPEKLEISAQNMIKIMNRGNPTIGTAVIYNPNATNCSFSLHSNNEDFFIFPDQGNLIAHTSAYINIGVSPSNKLLPGGHQYLDLNIRTEHGVFKKQIQVSY